MGILGINQGYSSESSHAGEEPNIDGTRFLKLLKYFNEPLWDGCANYYYLLVTTPMFIIKSN